MAKAPRAAQELDDEIEEGNAGQEDEVAGDEAGGGEEEASDDAALDAGPEQEVGDSEDVDDDQDNEPAPTRGVSRQQRLANENRDLRERLERLERQPTTPAQAGPQEETEEAFKARMALLDPVARMEATLERSQRNTAMTIQRMALQNQETTDKAMYDAKAAVDPRYKRWSAAVEAKRTELMNMGQIVPREAVLKFLLGERILAGGGSKEVRRAQARGQDRITRQRTQPSGGRSDVRADRRQLSDADARKKRLENAEI